MTDPVIDHISNQLSKTSFLQTGDGVSFKGKSLKLNSEKDCDEVVGAIKACQNLEYLNLEGNTLGVDAALAISKALEKKSELKRALWKDMFTGRMKEEIPKALEYLGNGLALAGAQLVELDLSDNAFGPIGVKGLAGLLSSQACYRLQELKLNNNGLGISGGKMLAEALLQCHRNSSKQGKALALKLLIVGRNRLENEGATALAQVFETLGSLESISMPQNGIYHKGIKALSSSFKKNPNLRVLDLNDNTITEKGANHIAEALPHIQKLQVLNLGDCLLRTGGATLLANALTEKHEDLEELHLGYNEIKSGGGLAIAKAVKNKTKLKQLNINGNHFGTSGRTQLKEDLEKSKRISTLGTLSDDESCDDEDSEHSSEDEEEEEELEKTSEQAEENGYSPAKESTLNWSCKEVKSSTGKEKTVDPLSNFLNDLSLKTHPVGALESFLKDPALHILLNVEKDKMYEFIGNIKNPSIDFFVDDFIPMLVKISTCENEKVMEMWERWVSSSMYIKLFDWARKENQLPAINNALFMHFGLIKSEDKNFKIGWDAKRSLNILCAAHLKSLLPASTEEILTCLLEKHKGGDQC